MNMLNDLLGVPLCTGPIFILAGVAMKIIPPRNVNSLYGYRTGRSMKSHESWEFSQEFSASELILWGLVLTASALLGLFIPPSPTAETMIGVGIMIICSLMPIFRTEAELKRRFG